MSRPFNPELDLTLSRIIKAPRLTTWRAFAEPALDRSKQHRQREHA